LAVALAGIGLGGALYARTRIKPTLAIFAITCAVEALAIAIPDALGDRLAMLALLLRPLCNSGFGAAILAWTFVAAIVVLPAAIVSGAQFPMVIGLYGTGSRSVGRDVGAAYLANTLGAIVGSIAGGFGLMPALSAPGCWRLVVGLLLGTAALALGLDLRDRGKAALLNRSGASAVACGLAAILLSASLGPTAAWRHSGIGAGRSDGRVTDVSPSTIPMFERLYGGSLAWEQDGLESSVAVSKSDGYAFIVNGKSDGHCRADGPTQVMGGMLGGLLHPDPKRAMVIGLGSGSTAGWLGAVQGMDRVDVVELEPAILRVARDCRAVNRDVMDNPKVHTSLGDAREALLTTREKYDIIFSEPSNPYRAGISSLYTVEFYRAAAERLNPHGLFIQWVQGYEVDAWCLATTMVTLKQVFKELTVWRAMGGDLLVIAQNDPAVIDVARMRKRLGEEAYASAAKAVWRTSSVEGVLSHFVANPLLAEAMVHHELGAVNHDDQNVLEFAFARSLGHDTMIDEDIQGLAARLHASTPRVTAPVDPALVFEERWLFQASAGRPLDPPIALAPPAERDFGAFLELHQAGQFANAFAAWKKLAREPQSYFEHELLAEAAPDVNDPRAQGYLDTFDREGQRELMHALQANRRGDLPAAVDFLVRGFVLHRKDPWIRLNVAKVSLDLAVDLAREVGRPGAIKLYDALGPAFAVEVLRNVRLTARSKIGALIDMRHCADALHELEPAPYANDLMRLRLTCYEQTNDPLTPLAREDVARLTRWRGTFAAGLQLSLEAPAADGPARPPRSP
jgi:spermidine synthase